MPREAVRRGAVDKSVPLDGIDREIQQQLQAAAA
jgi:chemotaxis response regulator CheB